MESMPSRDIPPAVRTVRPIWPMSAPWTGPPPGSATGGRCSSSTPSSPGPFASARWPRRCPGIATNVLSQRLKRLEADGLVVSTAYSARPPRFSYELTQAGRELAGVLALLAHWGAVAGGGEGVRHSACGTPLEARWWCPTCDRPVDDPDDEGELRFV